MVGKILQPEIKSIIDARDFGALREVFREWPPADVAEVILDMPEDEQVIIFRVLPHALAADVFEYIGIEEQQKLLRAMAHEQVVGILNEMSPDDRTALLEELPSAAARQLIWLLTPEERRVAQALLGYPEGSVGRLMTPDFIQVREDWTVQQVLDYVRQYGRDSETLNVIYVVDERGKLIDDVRIREFLLKPLAHKVSDLMEKTFVSLNVHDSQQDALNVFRKYDRTALPVVDSSGVLVGIVTIDDMLDVAEKEATEDIQKLGGNHPVSAHDSQTGWLARDFVSRRNADGDRNGVLSRGNCQGGRTGIVRAAHHFERWQLRFPSHNADHPGHGGRRSDAARLVESNAQGGSFRTHPWHHSRRDWLSADCRLGRLFFTFTVLTGR